MNTAPSFCTHCGRPLNLGTRFCGQCGQPVQPLPTAPAPPAPVSQAAPPPAPYPQPPAQAVPAGPPAPPPAPYAQPAPYPYPYPQAPAAVVEPIFGIVMGLQRRKGFLGMSSDSINMIVTPVRLVFVPMSRQEMNQAVVEARDEAKSQGKGFFGQIGAQLGWMDVVRRRYESMSVQAIMAQIPGCFFLTNAEIRRIRFKAAQSDPDGGSDSPAEMHIEANTKHRFSLLPGRENEARHLLKQTLGAVVR